MTMVVHCVLGFLGKNMGSKLKDGDTREKGPMPYRCPCSVGDEKSETRGNVHQMCIMQAGSVGGAVAAGLGWQ